MHEDDYVIEDDIAEQTGQATLDLTLKMECASCDHMRLRPDSTNYCYMFAKPPEDGAFCAQHTAIRDMAAAAGTSCEEVREAVKILACGNDGPTASDLRDALAADLSRQYNVIAFSQYRRAQRYQQHMLQLQRPKTPRALTQDDLERIENAKAKRLRKALKRRQNRCHTKK